MSSMSDFFANFMQFIAKVRNVVIFTGTIRTFQIELDIWWIWGPSGHRGRHALDRDIWRVRLVVWRRDHKLILFWLDSCKFRLHAHYPSQWLSGPTSTLIHLYHRLENLYFEFVRISGIQITKSVDRIIRHITALSGSNWPDILPVSL